MTVAIMQPYFFPYLGYYQLVNAVDSFIFFDDVNFIKKGWIHRNNLLINGTANLFSIPLKNLSQNKIINEVELSDYTNWRNKFLKTIEIAYKKAIFFKPRFEFISSILNHPYLTINELAAASVTGVANLLNLNTQFSYSRLFGTANVTGAEEKILYLCEKVSATTYINPINGRHLYDQNQFRKRSISLNFIQMKPVTYKQFNGNPFVPSLSMIDVLMHNSDEQIMQYLLEYQLV